jgi:hypothetical protein
VALAALLVFTGSTAQAQTCQPGIATAFFGPHNAKYQAIVNAMVPVFGQLSTELTAVVDQPTYQNLLNTANTLAGSLATGRVVITLPDGTVVIDTSKGGTNTFANFQAKTINENHNSRLAILAAQEYACGIGVESKFSTSTNQTESYVAIRTGPQLDSAGTIRMSVKE